MGTFDFFFFFFFCQAKQASSRIAFDMICDEITLTWRHFNRILRRQFCGTDVWLNCNHAIQRCWLYSSKLNTGKGATEYLMNTSSSYYMYLSYCSVINSWFGTQSATEITIKATLDSNRTYKVVCYVANTRWKDDLCRGHMAYWVPITHVAARRILQERHMGVTGITGQWSVDFPHKGSAMRQSVPISWHQYGVTFPTYFVEICPSNYLKCVPWPTFASAVTWHWACA